MVNIDEAMCVSVCRQRPWMSVSACVPPRREARGFLLSPPCLESQGCQFDPTFLYVSSLVLLPSLVPLSVLSFSAFGSFS